MKKFIIIVFGLLLIATIILLSYRKLQEGVSNNTTNEAVIEERENVTVPPPKTTKLAPEKEKGLIKYSDEKEIIYIPFGSKENQLVSEHTSDVSMGPHDFSVDKYGNIYIFDAWRLKKFNNKGQFVFSLVNRYDKSIYISHEGNIYFLESESRILSKYTNNNLSWKVIIDTETDSNRFNCCFSQDEEIFVIELGKSGERITEKRKDWKSGKIREVTSRKFEENNILYKFNAINKKKELKYVFNELQSKYIGSEAVFFSRGNIYFINRPRIETKVFYLQDMRRKLYPEVKIVLFNLRKFEIVKEFYIVLPKVYFDEYKQNGVKCPVFEGVDLEGYLYFSSSGDSVLDESLPNSVCIFNCNGELVREITLSKKYLRCMGQTFYCSYDDIEIDIYGNIYQMYSDDNGVHILEWERIRKK